ncbi:MAG: VWA domain-containing protein [Pseudomonadota bacterium]
MKYLLNCCTRISSKALSYAAALRHDQRGMSLALFAAAVVPTFSAIGTGVDVTRMMMLRSKLTAAVDAAALAGGRVYFSEDRQDDIESYFKANLPEGFFDADIDGPYSAEDNTKGTLRVWASASMPTGFMRLFGVDDLSVSTESVITRQTAMLDVVLAIDLSGSMLSSVPGEAKSRIVAAKEASEQLIDIIYGDPPSSLVRVGVVPWAGKVNVSDYGTTHGYDALGNELPEPVGMGSINTRYRAVDLGASYNNPFQAEYYTYSYIPGGTNAPLNGVEDDPFVDGSSTAKERFLLPDGHEDWTSKVYYAHNSSVPLLAPPPKDWKGCVYARYASTARPFAHDEAGEWYDKQVDDDNSADTEDGIVTEWGPNQLNWVGWMPMGEEGEPIDGNDKCDLSRLHNLWSDCTPCMESGIHRLNYSKDAAITMIKDLEAVSSGFTNIPQGLVWANRLLSKAVPFTEGDEVDVALAGYARDRAIVLLSDGANTVREGDAYNRALRFQSDRDERLRYIADKIKDQETNIYAVQFANGDSNLAQLMKDVASKPTAPFYYYAPSSSELQSSFKAVANNLSTLRISK